MTTEAAQPPRASAREHLHYVDLVRVLTVALVIGVHVLAFAPVAPNIALGAVTVVFHVSREVFFLLTAFVLTYGTGRGAVRWPVFWRRRYLFVVLPYLLWSLVYFVANPVPWTPVASAVGEFGHELLTGTARYHLYFLLVSMQIYLVFPLIRGLLRVTRRHHGLLLTGCAAFQLLFELAVQQQWQAGPLTGWLRGPDALLPSYLGYVVAGAVAGWHREELIGWTRRHSRRVFAGCAAAVGLGIGVYLVQVWVAGQTPPTAAAVFQPVVVVESVAIGWAFLAAGLRWQDRGRPAHRLVRAGSDASFGIYLSHPLLLQAVVAGVAATGLAATAQRSPTAVVLLVLVLVVTPLLYLASGLLSAAARRSPLSLPITGRLRSRRPTAVVAEPVLPAFSLAVSPSVTPGGFR
jgi:peptidoglycan/LPS O-acetylase OafA/YrhL